MTTTKQDHVQACADTLAEIEQAHEALDAKYDRLHRQIGDAFEAGVGKHAEAVRIRAGLNAAKGSNSAAQEKTLSMHAKCTAIAIREGCDVPAALAIDGGLVKPAEGGR